MWHNLYSPKKVLKIIANIIRYYYYYVNKKYNDDIDLMSNNA